MHKENYKINFGFTWGRNDLLRFILFSTDTMPTFSKMRIEDEAKWQHEILQHNFRSASHFTYHPCFSL